jgi:hypothetical protein
MLAEVGQARHLLLVAPGVVGQVGNILQLQILMAPQVLVGLQTLEVVVGVAHQETGRLLPDLLVVTEALELLS